MDTNNIFEFNKPNIRKIKETIIDHILISTLFNSGYKAIIKNTTKKTTPKLRFELILILSIQ